MCDRNVELIKEIVMNWKFGRTRNAVGSNTSQHVSVSVAFLSSPKFP